MNNEELNFNQIETTNVDESGNMVDPTINEEANVYNNPIDEKDIASQLKSTMDGVITPMEITEDNSAQAKELLTGMVTFDYNNVPITDIVNSMILDSINKGASDIHFDPFEEGIKVRIRIDGELNDYSIVPLFVKKNIITRIKIISGMNITESRIPQDGAIRTEIAGKTIDLRVSCLPTNLGEKIVIRIMDYSMSAKGIDNLDFNEANLEKVKKMVALPNGIILVTGATGTGKSTTVYSMLQRLNTEDRNIVTVEDPIEMNIGGINQVQAQAEIGLNFATVLRSVLRQDPDVIMIGEIRDDETARIAVRASITGHLVLSTIHTNNSLNTIERLTDMSVERYLLGSSLSGIISQKLSRRLCEKCKEKRPTTDYEKEMFKNTLNKDVDEIYVPVGCSECNHGYRGRIAIHEVLLLNQEIKDAITSGIDKATLRKIVYGEHGTETMLQDGLSKVLEGKTSFEEILKLIDLEDDLGSGSELGLKNQLEFANKQQSNDNQPQININITPELLMSLKSTDFKELPKLEENEHQKEISNEEENNDSSIVKENDEKEYSPTLVEERTISSEEKLQKELDKLINLIHVINKKKFVINATKTLNNIENLLNDIQFANDYLTYSVIEKITELYQKIKAYVAKENDNDKINSYSYIMNRLLDIFNLNIENDSSFEEEMENMIDDIVAPNLFEEEPSSDDTKIEDTSEIKVYDQFDEEKTNNTQNEDNNNTDKDDLEDWDDLDSLIDYDIFNKIDFDDLNVAETDEKELDFVANSVEENEEIIDELLYDGLDTLDKIIEDNSHITDEMKEIESNNTSEQIDVLDDNSVNDDDLKVLDEIDETNVNNSTQFANIDDILDNQNEYNTTAIDTSIINSLLDNIDDIES